MSVLKITPTTEAQRTAAASKLIVPVPPATRQPSVNQFPFLTDAQANQTNSQGQAPKAVTSKTSLFITNIVQPGDILPVPISGNTFYVTAATAPLNIRPRGGIFNSYVAGTGLALDLSNSFDLLEIQNTSSFAIVFQIFVGFDAYIDKRLFLTAQQNPQVVFPTYPTANAAAVINVTDLSGQVITDINGVQWYAMYRSAIIACNIDSGTTYLLQRANASGPASPAIAAVYPLTSLRLDISGNYRFATGGGNINMIVSEIYTCIPKT